MIVDIENMIFNLGLIFAGITLLCISVYLVATEIIIARKIDKND
tara:strand:- start:562 stop:693 length:132 start_codon:yes stop_codon:yes gene_type:complete